MTSEKFLTYDEELEISDRLVARRRLRDLLIKEGASEPRTEEEQRIWDDGNAASKSLVEAYLPFVASLAHSVYMNKNLHYRGGTHVGVDDLMQHGAVSLINLTWAFDARGRNEKNPNAGRRFSTYSRLHVLKEMNRLAAASSTQYSASVDTIQASWEWLSTRSDLISETGAIPTDEQVSERSGWRSDFVIKDLPSRRTANDVDDPAVVIRRKDEGRIDRAIEAKADAGTLRLMLTDIMSEDLVDKFMLFMGVDSGIPRAADEVAKITQTTRLETAIDEQMIYAFLRHPQTRVALADKISEYRALTNQ